MERFRKRSGNEGTKSVLPEAQRAGKEGPKSELTRRRLWLFRLLCVSFPFVLVLLAEIAFRIIPGLNEERDPNVNISPVSVFARTTDPVTGKEYYNITHKHVMNAEGVRFLVKKPPNTIRIFCLGSSACAGWPHPPAETFSAYLEGALRKAYPGKQVEVLNVAAHGFAAYRTRRVLDEVVKMQPDALLVWEGNNEFLEERNYETTGAAIGNLGRHLRTVQWLRSRFSHQNELSGAGVKGLAEFFWKRIHQQSARLREDPVQFAKVQEHFRLSFEQMVRKSQRYHVPIVLCTVPVNLRDWLPTVSRNTLSGPQLEQWRKLFYKGRRCLIEEKYREGVQAMEQAIAMESEHAESYFWLGRLLEADGQKSLAWEAYSKARDKDYNPFRALSSFNDDIRKLAQKNQNKGVYLLDLDRTFAGVSRFAAPGFDLFLDYVHPTKPGNLLVAKNAFDLMTGNGVLKDKPALYQFSYSPGDGQAYHDQTDDRLQEVVITMAIENRQYEAVIRLLEAFVRQRTGRVLSGPEDEIFSYIKPLIAEGYCGARKYLEVQRRFIMELPASEAEFQEVNRQLDQFYDQGFPFGVF